jgi:hypothetical protein
MATAAVAVAIVSIHWRPEALYGNIVAENGKMSCGPRVLMNDDVTTGSGQIWGRF